MGDKHVTHMYKPKDDFIGNSRVYHMYNNDNDIIQMSNTNGDSKVNIPTDLSNIKVSGDSADRAKQVKLKLNRNRVREI
jgi:hypothetical protein